MPKKAPSITFFPVGNGDMTLIRLPGLHQYTILVDCYLLEEATETTPTTVDDLFEELSRDDNDRPYVDAFVLTHPDDDHCHGAKDFLHLAPPGDYNDKPAAGARKKVFLREMWSAPMVFRRKGKDETLTEDARQIKREAKRRVQEFRTNDAISADQMPDGDRVLILGQDQSKDGSDRLEGLDGIHIDVDEKIEKKDEEGLRLEAYVRGPLPPMDSEEEEEKLASNRSSIILQHRVHVGGSANNWILMGGDAEVDVWRFLDRRHKGDMNALVYDLLLAPHHCSWGVLSEEKATEAANADPEAREALGQNTNGAFIVTSSKPILDNDDNPPAHRAKVEYIDILDGDSDNFFCTGEWPNKDDPELLTFEFTSKGPKPPSEGPKGKTASAMISSLATTEREHG